MSRTAGGEDVFALIAKTMVLHCYAPDVQETCAGALHQVLNRPTNAQKIPTNTQKRPTNIYKGHLMRECVANRDAIAALEFELPSSVCEQSSAP